MERMGYLDGVISATADYLQKLELPGQVRALEYLCRSGSWIPKPSGGT